jgi:cytidine deaminase
MSMKIRNDVKQRLMQLARDASEKSYSPYSHFRVGAALLCKDGSIFQGTNVENRSFGLTNCAERSALFSAVSAGKKDFSAVAIYSPDADSPTPPCGACRQVLSEFGAEDFLVIMSGGNAVLEKSLGELLPMDSLHELRE